MKIQPVYQQNFTSFGAQPSTCGLLHWQSERRARTHRDSPTRPAPPPGYFAMAILPRQT